MPSRSTPVMGLVTVLFLAGSPLAVNGQGPLPPADVVAVGAPAIAKPVSEHSAQSSGAQPPVAPAMRGRWGGAVGVMYLGGSATFDYKNSSTPFAGASGPYTGAVIETDNVGPGFIFSGGYRGPFHSGSKVGFGFDAEFGGGGGHPADKQVIGTSPTGTQVTFSTDRGWHR